MLLLEDSVLVHAAALVVGVDALEALIRHFTEAGKSAVAAKLMWALWATKYSSFDTEAAALENSALDLLKECGPWNGDVDKFIMEKSDTTEWWAFVTLCEYALQFHFFVSSIFAL